MFARNFREAVKVHSRLMEDGLIGAQDIYVRQYVELKKLGEAIGGLPLTEEFRFFIYKGRILCGGFYWDAYHDDIMEQYGSIPKVENVPESFLNEAMRRIGDNVQFYALDVGRKADGNWIVIELNDGQMSGLSANSPEMLYNALFAEMLES
jgi:hypothetical protein